MMEPSREAVMAAREALLQPLLRHCALYLPAEALAALREDLATLRDRARRGGTADAAAMAAACETALADLAAAAPPITTHLGPEGARP
ncbi:MAG: hypothetical protein ACK4ST_02510 [Elioraea tepidiphila]